MLRGGREGGKKERRGKRSLASPEAQDESRRIECEPRKTSSKLGCT